MYHEAATHSRPLTAWNQAALRGYIRQVHCFATDGGSEALDGFQRQLKEALRLVCLRTPYMAGKLSLSKERPGVLMLRTNEDDQVCLETCDARQETSLVYAKLRDQGFPAGAFVGPLFSNKRPLTEDGPLVPVAELMLILVDGGILLSVFVYHAVTDGVGVNNFLAAVALAMKTADGAQQEALSYPSRIDIPIPASSPRAETNDELVKQLHAQCPEFDLVDVAEGRKDHFGHLYKVSAVKFGGIFVFGPERLRLVKDAAVSAGYPSTPSTFACLAALSWSFMTTTRLATVGIAEESQRNDIECRIVIPTWWGDRLFRDELTGYAGNAVAFTEARHGAADLFTIAATPSTESSEAKDALRRVIEKIETTLSSVDEDFVKTRSALFNAVPDLRLPQYNFQPSDPRQLFFNSWRRLGADIEWTIPTTSGPKLVTADAVRKSQDAWNESAGLIMPGRRDQKEYEAVLSSDEDSMASLQKNETWKSWVNREVF